MSAFFLGQNGSDLYENNQRIGTEVTFELGHRVDGNKKFLTTSKIFLATAIAVVIALVQLSAFSTSAQATPPKTNTAITTCPKAISSMNSALVNIAKRRIAVRAAKGKGAKKVKNAKKSLKSAQKTGNNVRTAITKLCLGANGLSALDAQCSISITSLSARSTSRTPARWPTRRSRASRPRQRRRSAR